MMDTEPEMSERMESCPDCGRIVSREAAACPKCGHFFGLGRRIRKEKKVWPKRGGIGWAWFAIVFFIGLIMIPIVGGLMEETKYQKQKSTVSPPELNAPINYIICGETGPDGAGLSSIYILVSDSNNSNQIWELARFLKQKYAATGKWLWIGIYDNESPIRTLLRRPQKGDVQNPPPGSFYTDADKKKMDKNYLLYIWLNAPDVPGLGKIPDDITWVTRPRDN